MRIIVVALGLVLAGCANEVDGSAVARPAPAREVIAWADMMCVTTTAFDRVQQGGEEGLKEMAQPSQDGEYYARSFLSQASSYVDELDRALATVEPVGIDAADVLRADYVRELDRIKPEVAMLADFTKINGLGADEVVNHAKRVAELIASLNRPSPDLAAVMKSDPVLADARRLAPRCEQPVPPTTSSTPPSSDGPPPSRELGACKGGACKVAVSGQVDIPIGDVTINVTVQDDRVIMRQSFGSGGMSTITLGGVGGTAKFGQVNKGTITIILVALDGGEAVLDIATS